MRQAAAKDSAWPCGYRCPRGTEGARLQSGLMRAICGNPVRVRPAFGWSGKPTVRGAQFPGGNRMPKKRMPVAERQQESEAAMASSPLAVPYNWPDTGPGARTRKRADVGR